MRIGIDAMGGDHAPAAEVNGALAARDGLQEGDRVVLIGDESAIAERLDGQDGWQDFIELRHAPEAIGMDEAPVEALRSKPNSSLAVMVRMHAAGELDACISAGNTGAFVAASQMNLRRLPGVHRPGIAIITPTYRGPVGICDVGANVNCRPQHLYQYGLMATIYLNNICHIENPRVGLLSIGAEDAKGNELVKRTRDLLKDEPAIRFIGNVEGRDLFQGACDVMVCDGFVGNVVLKLMEGMAGGVVQALLSELASALPDKAEAVKKAAKSIITRFDYNEYGGAPLLGVGGICIICHGDSNYRGIKNAVRVAADFSKFRINQQITDLLSRGKRTVNV